MSFSEAIGVWLHQLFFGKVAKLLKIETKQSKIKKPVATRSPAEMMLSNTEGCWSHVYKSRGAVDSALPPPVFSSLVPPCV